jgi:hypothetical protein
MLCFNLLRLQGIKQPHMIRVLFDQQFNQQCANKRRPTALNTFNSQPSISLASLTRIARITAYTSITAYNSSADGIGALYFYHRSADRLKFRDDEIQ